MNLDPAIMAILNTKVNTKEIKNVFLLLRDHKLSEALKAIKEGLDKAQTDKNKPLVVAYYCALGLAFRYKEQYDRALKAYLKAQELLPDEPTLVLLSTRLQAQYTGQYAQAIKALANILPQIKNNFMNLHHAYTTIGLCYFNQGKFDKSIDFLKRSVGDRFKGLINPANLELVLVQKFLKKNMALKECRDFMQHAASFAGRCQEKEIEKFFREIIKSIKSDSES